MSVCIGGRGDFVYWHHTSLIGMLASSSAPFRRVPGIIYRWEYFISKGERAGLPPGKRRKKVSFWEGGQKTLGKREVKCQMGQELRAWRKTGKRDAPGKELGMVSEGMPSE